MQSSETLPWWQLAPAWPRRGNHQPPHCLLIKTTLRWTKLWIHMWRWWQGRSPPWQRQELLDLQLALLTCKVQVNKGKANIQILELTLNKTLTGIDQRWIRLLLACVEARRQVSPGTDSSSQYSPENLTLSSYRCSLSRLSTPTWGTAWTEIRNVRYYSSDKPA